MFPDTCWHGHLFLFQYLELVPKICPQLSVTPCTMCERVFVCVCVCVCVWAIRQGCSYAKPTLHQDVWSNKGNAQIFLSYALYWVVIFTLRPNYHRGKSFQYPLYRRSIFQHTCTCYKRVFFFRLKYGHSKVNQTQLLPNTAQKFRNRDICL
jgi:hypothetical protein